MNLPIAKRVKFVIDKVRDRLTKKQFIYFSSVLVGISAGLAAVLLKVFVHYIYLIVTSEKLGLSRYFYIFLPLTGILLTILVVKKILKGKLEKGLSHIHYAIAQKMGFIPREQMYAQILTSSVTVGMGGSAGLEAPIVITGAALGSNYARSYLLNTKERTLLLACGIAAGIGSAFNAPIAGVLFALEVLLLDITISAFTPLIIAAATGALMSKIILQDDILLSFQLQQPFDYKNVPFYILLGLAAGLISIYHARIFVKVEKLFGKSPKKIYLNAIIGGLSLAALISVFPSLFGEGYNSIKILSLQQPEKLLDNSILKEYKNNELLVLGFVGLLIFLKPVATALTLGAGGNGGNFAPSLFTGAYLGFFFSRVLNFLGLTTLPESNFTIVGMAGILSGIYHAPLTAIFLIAEITGGYTLMIPLMIVSSISFAVSRYFEPFSMDTKKLAGLGMIFTQDKEHNILTTIKTSSLIEKDFSILHPNQSLGYMVKVLSGSHRNIFPVTDNENNLVGVVDIALIRDIIFKPEIYEKVQIKELMIVPSIVVSPSETVKEVMEKFDESGTWFLPVANEGQYVGFISKLTLFASYRERLRLTVID